MRGMTYVAPAIVALALMPVVSHAASAAADPTGIWINDTGRGAVEIKACGSKLCGNVVWVKSSKDNEGCGKQVIGEVANVGGGVWDNGWVYSPERGRKYDVELRPLNNGTLQVTGYAGSKWFSQTMIWTRAPQDLKLCVGTDAKTETPKSAPKVAAVDPAPASSRMTDGGAALSDDEPASVKKPVAPAKKEAAPESVENKGKAEAAPAPKAQDNSAAAPSDDPAPSATADKDDDDNSNSKPSARAGNARGGINLGNLKLDQMLTKTGAGNCLLNTPWIKVQFHCER